MIYGRLALFSVDSFPCVSVAKARVEEDQALTPHFLVANHYQDGH